MVKHVTSDAESGFIKEHKMKHSHLLLFSFEIHSSVCALLPYYIWQLLEQSAACREHHS
jgi:hypothetical protein